MRFFIPTLPVMLLALTFCANQNTKSTTTNQFTLALTDSVAIEVNDQSNVQGIVQLISAGDNEWLSCYQYEEGVNNFHLYDLNSRHYVKTIKFAAEGPTGVGRVSPIMTFVSFDSIFLYRVNANIFYHVDSSGTILSTVDLSGIESGTIHVSAWFPPKIIEEKLYFFRIGAENPNSRRFLKESKAEGVFDLVSGRYRVERPAYPDYPAGYEASMENWKASRCVGPNNEFVYSFPFDSHLFVYKNELVEQIDIPNSNRPVTPAVSPIDPQSFESQMRFTATVGMYTYLIHDPFNHLYYRIYLKPGNFIDNENNVIKVADFAWDLEIIDEDFNLVGRYSFPPRKYNPYNVLLSKKGILVSTVNPYAPKQENFLTYSLFRPVQAN